MGKIFSYLSVLILISACGSTINKKDIQPLTNNDQSQPLSEEEQSLLKRSKRLHKTFINKGLIVRNKEANQMINAIAGKLAPRFEHDNISLNFYILKDASINAFALPNGNVYLNLGLINKLSSESQLALVIAHEVAHVVQKHGLKKLVDRKNTVATSHVADLFLFGTGLIYYAAISDLASYSREMEHEADSFALEYLANTGYDLNDGITAFNRLQEVKYKKEGGSIWSTHPDIDSRIKESEIKIQQLSWLPSLNTTSTTSYDLFRKSLIESVVKIRLRNKQFELAEDTIKEELALNDNNAMLYYYLGEVNRLKATQIKAYAREYAWLYDEDFDEDLKIKLKKNQPTYFSQAKNHYEKAYALNSQLNVTNKGLGLLAFNQGDTDVAHDYLEKYLQADDVKDRRYITSILKGI